jgi:hypothetical protein
VELENINLSEIRLRRPNIACFPSYADYRPKTNAVILLDMVTQYGETMHRRDRERKGNQNLECG